MAREAIAEQDDQQGGTYRLELVSCGKPNCTRCAEGPAHGPYWYRYYRRGGKVVSKYIGKTLPAADADYLVTRGDISADTARLLSQAAPVPAAEEPPRTEQRIRDAQRALIAALNADPDEFVWLEDLRQRLPDLPREVLDAALIGMYISQEINLVPSADQHSSVLTPARRAAGLSSGGKTKHRISFP